MLANNVCEKIILTTEKQLNIPKYLLLSIALTESGRSIDGEFLPWPWSINTRGKGRFFDTKEELVSYAQNNLKKRIRNFDVGCMQINYYYHGKKFNNLDEMANPKINIIWAGRFLINLHKKHKSWKEAISRYHSNTKWRKQEYFRKVMNNWSYKRRNPPYEVALVDNLSEQNKKNMEIKNKLPLEVKNKKQTNNKKLILKNTKKEEFVKIEKSTNEYKNSIVIENEEEFVKKKTSSPENYTNILVSEYENIRLSGEARSKLEKELIDFVPEEVSEILFVNEFKYMKRSTILDNLKRIEDYKKNR